MKKIAGTIKIFAVLTYLFVIGLFVTEQAFAWTQTATFEDGAVGSLAQNCSTCFDGAGTQTTISTTHANTGTKSAKMHWIKGVDAFGKEHATFNAPSAVTDGGEIWARAYFYFDAPWSWVSNSGTYSTIKVLRFPTDSGGMCGVLSNSNGAILITNEPAVLQPTLSAIFDIGHWQSIEIYEKVSTGNSGIIRVWKDGVLIGEQTGVKTLAGRSINATQFMAVWNNSVGNTQDEYIDDVVITTNTPSQRDSHGNAMIGPISGISNAALVPPTGLRVTAN